VYSDQIETIRQLAFEEQMRGGKMNMSEMVREALDDYIAKRTKTQK
jgi:metal-responsive CopG/Arc/MetJ family transcriptional regulator